MGLTRIAGESNDSAGTLNATWSYAIMMSSATAADGGFTKPDGNYVSFYCQSIKLPDKILAVKKPIAGGSSTKIIVERRDLKVTLNDVLITKKVGATATDEFNLVRNFIRDYGQKIGAAKAYIYIKNITDNVYINLSWDSNGDPTRYMKGHPVPTNWDLEKGNLYMAGALIFEEVSI